MKNKRKNIWIPVLAVAFGYFVDLYDLLLFSCIRVESFNELHITGENATQTTKSLLNFTVGGMVLGGFFWGWLADKKGRMSILFASIITYSIANLVNGYVNDINLYKACRLIAGFGLAGELGVGLTLVSELLPNNKRTHANLIIIATGMLGAVLAGSLSFLLKGHSILGMSSWRALFILGAFLGFLLLIFRISISESNLFKETSNQNKGNLKLLFFNKQRANKFLFCVLSGLPVFFIIGNFVSLSPEYGKLQGLNTVQSSLCIVSCYIGLCLFDIIGTLISKKIQSRKKVIFGFLFFQLTASLFYLYFPSFNSDSFFYFKIFLLGSSVGLWGVLNLNSVEQFGTNLRSTVSTSVPNLIRGALVPLTILFFEPIKTITSITSSGAIVVLSCILIAFYATYRLTDKFENSLDFQEK